MELPISNEFIEFMDSLDFEGKRFYKTELKDYFITEYDDYKFQKWFTTSLFNKWVDKYCKYNNLVFDKGQDSHGGRFITIEKLPF